MVGEEICAGTVGGNLVKQERTRMTMSGSELVSCYQDAAKIKESGKSDLEEVRIVGSSSEKSSVLISCDSELVDVKKNEGVLDMEKDLTDRKFNLAKCYDTSGHGSVTGPAEAKNPLEVSKEMKKNAFGSPSNSEKTVKVPPVKTTSQLVEMSGCGSGTGPAEVKNPLEVWKEMKHFSQKAVKVSSARSRLQDVDMSECASVTGPPVAEDPLEEWKEMKRKGFLSSLLSQKAVTVLPVKNRGRKSKAEVTKRELEQARIEQAKKEQVDSFAELAAPIGLLHDLNPSIINHVRNSKQVHSIIKALARPEGRLASPNKCSNLSEIKERKAKRGLDESNFLHPDEYPHSERKSTNNERNSKRFSGFPSATDETDTSLLEKDVGIEDNNFASSLSLKAAGVASLWLELLQQDIKGRLAALKRSKKRVCAVLQTELPNLLSIEFHSSQKDKPFAVKSPTAELHEMRWKSLFVQMGTTLSDEELQLESWLEQVQEMQLLCDKGLYCGHPSISANFYGHYELLRMI